MATTTNYGWTTPDDTGLVKDGALNIRTLGSAIDTTSATTNLAGLVLIKTQTIGNTVASVNVTSAFSATYEAYIVQITGGVASASPNIALKLGASTASYLNTLFLVTYATAATSQASESNGAAITWAGSANTSGINMSIDLINPFLAKPTNYFARYTSTAQAGTTAGIHNVATSYTDFTITPSTGTLTGGTIYVYGYRKAI